MGSRSDGEDWIATVPPVGYRYMLPSDDRTQEEAKLSRRSITVGSSAVDLLVVDCVVNANHTPLAELPSGRGRSCEGISARFRALRMVGSRPTWMVVYLSPLSGIESGTGKLNEPRDIPESCRGGAARAPTRPSSSARLIPQLLRIQKWIGAFSNSRRSSAGRGRNRQLRGRSGSVVDGLEDDCLFSALPKVDRCVTAVLFVVLTRFGNSSGDRSALACEPPALGPAPRERPDVVDLENFEAHVHEFDDSRLRVRRLISINRWTGNPHQAVRFYPVCHLPRA